MKIVLAVAVLELLAVGCSKSSSPPPSFGLSAPAVDEALSARSVTALAKAMEREGQPIAAKASKITLIRGRILTVHAKTDYVTDQKNQVLVGLSYSLDVDDKPVPSLASGSLGIDPSGPKAFENAIDDWALQYGLAIARALDGPREAGRTAAPVEGPFQAGRFTFYPGFTGIRGEAPDAIYGAPQVIKAFLAHVAPLVDQSVPAADSGLHAVTLTLLFKQGASIEGECRLDGQVSGKLLDLVRSFAWPAVKGTFMLKQYFVFTAGASAGAGS